MLCSEWGDVSDVCSIFKHPIYLIVFYILIQFLTMVVVHPTLFINPGRSVIGCTVVNDYWYLNFTSFNSTISFKITTHLFLTQSA